MARRSDEVGAEASRPGGARQVRGSGWLQAQPGENPPASALPRAGSRIAVKVTLVAIVSEDAPDESFVATKKAFLDAALSADALTGLEDVCLTWGPVRPWWRRVGTWFQRSRTWDEKLRAQAKEVLRDA